MDKSSIHARIGELERELADVKQAAGLAALQGRGGSLRKLVRFVVSHWVLISFVAGLLVAAYVKETYGIDYFESYRQQATQRKIAEIHRQLGDRLMAYSEWTAAANAYRHAIEADANNEAATQGLLLATVYEPLGEQRWVADDVVNARLRFVSEAFGDDYRVCFLKAIQSLQWGELDEAERQNLRSIELNPLFPGAYVQLGYLLMGTYDLPSKSWRIDLARAAGYFEEAVRLDPENGLALNNLGYCSFLQRKFAVAADHLERSNALAPSLVTALNLGDVQRSMGNFLGAYSWHRIAYVNAMAPEMAKERYVDGNWKFNHLPLGDDDAARVQWLVIVSDLPTKQALAAFHLSFDHALLGQMAEAERRFTEGAGFTATTLGPLLVNRIEVIEHLAGIDPRILAWFAEKKQELLR